MGLGQTVEPSYVRSGFVELSKLIERLGLPPGTAKSFVVAFIVASGSHCLLGLSAYGHKIDQQAVLGLVHGAASGLNQTFCGALGDMQNKAGFDIVAPYIPHIVSGLSGLVIRGAPWMAKLAVGSPNPVATAGIASVAASMALYGIFSSAYEEGTSMLSTAALLKVASSIVTGAGGLEMVKFVYGTVSKWLRDLVLMMNAPAQRWVDFVLRTAFVVLTTTVVTWYLLALWGSLTVEEAAAEAGHALAEGGKTIRTAVEYSKTIFEFSPPVRAVMAASASQRFGFGGPVAQYDPYLFPGDRADAVAGAVVNIHRSGDVNITSGDRALIDKLAHGIAVPKYRANDGDWTAAIGKSEQEFGALDPKKLPLGEDWVFVPKQLFEQSTGSGLPEGSAGIAVNVGAARSHVDPIYTMIRTTNTSVGLMARGAERALDNLIEEKHRFQWKPDAEPFATLGDPPSEIMIGILKKLIVEVEKPPSGLPGSSYVFLKTMLTAAIVHAAERYIFGPGDVSLKTGKGVASLFAPFAGGVFQYSIEIGVVNLMLLDTWNELCRGTSGLETQAKIRAYVSQVQAGIGGASEEFLEDLVKSFHNLKSEYNDAGDKREPAVKLLLSSDPIGDDFAKVRQARLALWHMISARGFQDTAIMTLYSRISWIAPRGKCAKCKDANAGPSFWTWEDPNRPPIATFFPEPSGENPNYGHMFNSLRGKMKPMCLACYAEECTTKITAMHNRGIVGDELQGALDDQELNINMMTAMIGNNQTARLYVERCYGSLKRLGPVRAMAEKQKQIEEILANLRAGRLLP